MRSVLKQTNVGTQSETSVVSDIREGRFVQDMENKLRVLGA